MGIVSPSERGPVCLCNQCKHNKYSCVHIRQVLKQVEPIPDILRRIIDSQDQSTKAQKISKSNQNQLLSTIKIPFKLPLQLRSMLTKTHSERFKQDAAGVCHLSGDCTVPCGVCGLINWAENESLSNTRIITQNRVLKAVGKCE